MKILDMGNAPKRLQVFLIWGAVIFIFQLVGGMIFSPNTNGGLIMILLNLLISGFAGFMTAGALKNNTGDKKPSTIYGALPPIFALIISWVVGFFMNQPLSFHLPLLPMVAGLIGGYLSQRRLL